MIVTFRRLLTGQDSRQGLWFLPLTIGCLGFLWLLIGVDGFRNPQNLLNLITQAIPLLLVGLGQMLVILVGGLDLSVGSVVSLTTAILALDAPGYVLLPTVFLVAGLIGLINGLAITRLNVHPIIATLSMQIILRGITLILLPTAGGVIPEIVKQSVSGRLSVLWLAAAVLVGWKLIHGSRFGLHLFAIGGGVAADRQDTASKYGVADRRNVVLAYVLCSTFAAVAGVFLAGRIVSGDPNVGLLLEIDSITAVAIGGTQLTGGVGSLQGTIIGAIVMTLLANGMNLGNVSAFVQTIIKGSILLVIVALQSRKKIGL